MSRKKNVAHSLARTFVSVARTAKKKKHRLFRFLSFFSLPRSPPALFRRTHMRASPNRRMGSYERFQDSVRVLSLKKTAAAFEIGSTPLFFLLSFPFLCPSSLSPRLPLSLPLPPSLFEPPFPGHRGRLGPRGLRHHARRRRRRGRLPLPRDRHGAPAAGRGNDLPGVCEAGGDGKAAERGPRCGVGPADRGAAGLLARILCVEDRVLRVEEEGGVLFRGYPSRVE